MSDEAVMIEIRDGRVGMLAALFERHHRTLFNFFHRLTGSREQSEDLTQEVFMRILKYRSSYEPRTSYTAWMYQVARNVHNDALGKGRRETQWMGTDNEAFPEPPSREPRADDALQREQEVGLVRRALAALPVEKREVLVLSRYQNLKYEQIGQILGCDAGAVKVRVYRALRALGRVFAEMAGETR
jgi:RNA polymerase sigma-70 factor (ECF subfamily)